MKNLQHYFNFVIIMLIAIMLFFLFTNDYKPVEKNNSKYTGLDSINYNSQMLISDHILDKLIISLAKIESNNNPKAHNKKTDAAGLLQITPIYLKEVNKYTFNKYSLNDRFDSLKNIEMFKIFNRIHNPSFDIETAIFLHNPKAGNSYLKKVLYQYYNK